MASAASIWPSSSRLRKRAVRRIQKTIQVTKPTAMIDRVPPKRSWASKRQVARGEGEHSAEREAERDRRGTPIQTARNRDRRSVLTR